MNAFFSKPKSFKLKELVDENTKIIGDSDYIVEDVCPLQKLDSGKIACLHNTKYRAELEKLSKGVCILKEEDLRFLPKGMHALVTPNPYRVFGQIIAFLYPENKPQPKISNLSSISPSAKIGKNCTIDDFTVIGKNVEIGDNCWLKNQVVIGDHVKIGKGCTIESQVTVTNSTIGEKVYIKPGAKIGQQGFGFYMDEMGHFDVPQIGRVIIGNNVQIGANTTIDRGSQMDTIIGSGCRIDNLVQIAHNVEIGDNSILVAQVGIAGSTRLGKFVVAAGQVGIAGHLNISDNVKIAAQSGLMRDVVKGETVAGTPAVPVRDWHKQTIALKSLIKGKK